MIPQYSIINQCMQLLKLSTIPPIKKLRLEIQLIQLKRFMLNKDLPVELMRGTCSEDAFKTVLCQMRRINNEGRGADDAVSDLMDHLGTIIDQLSTDLSLKT